MTVQSSETTEERQEVLDISDTAQWRMLCSQWLVPESTVPPTAPVNCQSPTAHTINEPALTTKHKCQNQRQRVLQLHCNNQLSDILKYTIRRPHMVTSKF